MVQSGRFLACILLLFALNLTVEGATLNLNVRDAKDRPAAEVMFQIFPGSVDVDDDIEPLRLESQLSDSESFPGYATDSNGDLILSLASGSYTLVGFSKGQHFVLVEEVSVPDSITINVSDTVPVSISCRAADGSPIQSAEIFFRPTKRARSSLGFTDNGMLNAHVSSGEYHAVLQANLGVEFPHYFTLPHQTISHPRAEVNFHIADLPAGELYTDLPASAIIATLEVLDSTYTREHTESIEEDFSYDTHYTDFYSIINSQSPYMLSAGMDYGFSISFVSLFGAGLIYAYEFWPMWPDAYTVKPGTQHISIADSGEFTARIGSNSGDSDPVYHPGDIVALHYEFRDNRGSLLHRILSYSEARLVYPIVTIWDPDGVPIANNFGSEQFFDFIFQLPSSAVLGKYRAEVTLESGMYGKLTSEFHFGVAAAPDLMAPWIKLLDMPSEYEAGQDLPVSAIIMDNVGLADDPKLLLSMDDGASWTELTMVSAGDDLYETTAPAVLIVPGRLDWQITAQDLAGNSVKRSGVTDVADTLPPVIDHELIVSAELGHELRVQAKVEDNMAVVGVILFYTKADESQDSIEMSATDGVYSASISGSEVTFSGMSYYIQAADTEGNIAFVPVTTGAPKFASVTVRDTTAPIISHFPVSVGVTNISVEVEAIITDNSGVVEATLFYRGVGDRDYHSVSMSNNGDVYFVEIPADVVRQEGVQYHITAIDGIDPDENTRQSASPANGDHFIEIRSEPDGALAQLSLSPSANQDSLLEIAAGGTVKFTATGLNEAGELVSVDVIWTSTGGIGHIGQDGLFMAAGRIITAGVGRVIVTARHLDSHDAILQAETWIRISPGSPDHIMLNPGSVTIESGDSLRFFATVTDQYANPAQAEVQWSIEGDVNIGTVDDGVFNASKVGSGQIIAEANGLRAMSEIIVAHGALQDMVISPSPPDIGEVTAGETIEFTVEGYDALGNHILIAPVWSVRGGVGTIRGDGLFLGGKTGSGQVVAMVEDVSKAVGVTVVSGPLYSISVSPYIAYLPLSKSTYRSTQQFAADGWDIAGNPVPLEKVSWSTDELAGTISSSGLFIATDEGIKVGTIVTNGTIWATGRSASRDAVTERGFVVIQVSPADQLASISVLVQGTSGDPGSVPIAIGESVQFESVGNDVEGQNLSINPSWSVEGGIGDIDVNGLFTATKSGSGAIVATAGGFTGRAQIQITPGSLKSIAVRPDILILSPGTQRSLTAVAYDSAENVVSLDNYDIQWSIRGAGAGIDPAGESCMVTSKSPGDSIISVSVGNIMASANIFVSWTSIDGVISHTTPEVDYRDRPYYIQIEPELIGVAAGSQKQFTARLIDVLGDEIHSGNLSWSVVGGIGEIDSSGLFRAGDLPGSGSIIVTDGEILGTAAVVIPISAEGYSELLVTPAEVSLLSGMAQKLVALVKTTNGELIPILPAWRMIGNIGTVDASGLFLATNAGEGEIEAPASGLSARCRVTVSAGTPVQMEIQPNSSSIAAGEQEKFNSVSRDEAGNLVDSSPVFQIAGDMGTINGNGLFTARRAKSGSVLAAVSSGALLATADVEVFPGNLAELEVIPAEQTLLAGDFVKFFAVGRDAYGNVIPVDPVWEISGPADIGSVGLNGLFTADKAAQGQVRARAGGFVGAASVEVRPGAPAFIQVEPALISISSQEAGTKQFSYTFLDLRGNVAEAMYYAELSWTVTEEIGTIDPQTGLFMNAINLDEPRTGYVTATAVLNSGLEQERTIRGRAAVALTPTSKPLASVIVTPNPVQVIRGDTRKFAAVGRDADGVEMDIHPSWSVIGDNSSIEVPNAISADGVFSATSEMKVGSSWRVVASIINSENQLIRGEAGLSLTTGPLQSIEVICDDDSCVDPVESGQQVQMEAIGYDQFRNQIEIAPNWKVTGNIGAVSPVSGSESKAVLTAGLAGPGEVVAEAEAKEGKVHVIVITGQLASIDVSTDPAPSDENLGANEANPLVIKAGADVHFVAFGMDSDVDILGNPKPVNTIDISPEWSVVSSDEEADLGSIFSDGSFVGKETGVGRIVAEVDSVADSFYIRVAAGDLASIRVSPSPVSVVSGTQKQFSTSGHDLHGNEVSNYRPTWHVTGNTGNMDENGLFTAISLPPGSSPISGTVVASAGAVQGAASVTVVSALGKLAVISVSVEPSTVQAGGKATCILKGADEKGNPIADIPVSASPSVSAPANLGTVEASDMPNQWTFRAIRTLSPNPDKRVGLITARATVDDEILSADATITLVPGPLSKIFVEPASGSLPAGSTMTFEALGYDTWENQREISPPEWVVSGGIGDVTPDAGSAVFAGVIAGQGQLIASSQGYEGRADITVLPGGLETLIIEPGEITMPAGSSHHFAAMGKDQYGNEISNLELDWRVAGDRAIGTVTEDGLFSAVKAGNGRLSATYEDAAGVIYSDEASITIVPGSLVSAAISIHREGEMLEPPFALPSGVRYDLKVQGADALGNPVPNLEEVAWNVAADIGSIEFSPEDAAAAVLTTLLPGHGEIAVTVETISTHVEVEIIAHSQEVNSRIHTTVSGPFDASIEIPAGALRTNETISIALSPSPGPVAGAQRIGYVYSLEPDGMIFDSPVELTLSYAMATASEMDEERLSLYSWDRYQERWIRVGGKADIYQKSVTASVNYLSLFAIMQEESDTHDEPVDDKLDIYEIRLSPNTYFAPEINRLTIHYRIGGDLRQPIAITINIYDIRGRLVRELVDESPKYPGWNTDQWDGTDEAGETVKNGRYILLITAETDDGKVDKIKHLAILK